MSAAPIDLLIDLDTVVENAADGALVGTVSAQDPDAGDTFSFVLLDDAGGRFALDSLSGALSVADGFLLDYELAAQHTVTVRVTDSTGLSYDEVLVLNLVDLGESIWNGTTGPDSFATSAAEPWRIQGLKGPDAITTAAGNDIIAGGAGNDTLDAGAGDDLITFYGSAAGYDRVDGGAGADTIRALVAGTAIGLQGFSGIERITAGGLGGVWIQGSGAGNLFDFAGVEIIGIEAIRAGGGADTVFGSAGADVIDGGAGNDLLRGDLGDDLFLVGPGGGTDRIYGGAGTDTLRAQAAGLVVTLADLTGVEHVDAGGFAGVEIAGTIRADRLDFSGVTLSGIAAIRGGDGADTLVGSSAADVLEGGAGRDALQGGGGNDSFLVGLGAGTDVFAGDAGIDEIRATTTSTAIAIGAFSGIESISSGGFAGVRVVGTVLADALDFSGVSLAGIVAVDTGAGNDTLTGSAAADTLAGGGGADSVSGAGGADVLRGEGGNDLLQGDTGFDTLVGGAGADTLAGGAGSDVFRVSSREDSSVTGGIDMILDFLPGSDRIDVSPIDANRWVAGDQRFFFIGSHAFHGGAGELRFEDTGTGMLLVQGDIDGGGVADFEFLVAGATTLVAADFFI